MCVIYLQRALLSGFLIVALHYFAVDTQTQHLTGDSVVISHGMALDFQFGIDGQGELSGVGVCGLVLWVKRGALARFCLLHFGLRLGRVRVVCFRLSILKHFSVQMKLR